MVAAAQFERELGQKQRNLALACDWVRQAADGGAEVIGLPELCTTGYFPRGGRMERSYFAWAEPIPGPTTDRFAELTSELGVTTIVPLFERDSGSGKHFNSAAVVTPDGVAGSYRKRHIPSLRPPNMLEEYYFAVGDLGYPVFDLGRVRLGVSICYDRHFPETFRLLTYRGAELIISVSNTGSDRSRSLWNSEVQVNASSNGVYLLQVNAVGEEAGFFGLSLLSDPQGRIVSQLPQGEEGVLIAEVDLEQIVTARRHYSSIRDAHWEDFGFVEA